MIFLCAFGLSMLAVLALTPAVRNLATRLRFLDYPSHKKVHLAPTPLMGGLAVALASLAAAAAALAFIRSPYSAKIVGFLSGGLMVVVLGLADDANGMRPRVKLAGQTAAAAVMLLSGGVEGLPLPLPIAVPLALFWMVGLMNAFNFLDNMDGITSGLAAIATFGIFALALGHGNTYTAIAAISVAGGALGFLRYNFAPASIFLGDAGSLFLGYVVGGLSLRAVSYAGAGSQALLIPVLMLGYPIFDALLVTVARLREGRELSQGGRDHSSHRLARLGLSARQTAAVIYVISGALTAAAVYLARGGQGHPGLAAITAVAAAGGMLFLGVRLLRVPVEVRARAGLSATGREAPAASAAGGGSALVLRFADDELPEAEPDRESTPEPSRETVEVR
jgi:UDP-GlcNAc:undecaprenyl-phosphate GlcNAc-1-phosphate transferase